MKIIVGISGASGISIGKRLIDVLIEKGIDVSIIITEAARKVMEHEGQINLNHCTVFRSDELDALPASGSIRWDAMVIVPCSMKTLGEIANGIASNLLSRVADVALKEGRKLVLVPRETPLSLIHIENMARVKRAGAVVLPPSVAFYPEPRDINDVVDFIVGKILDSLGIENELYKRYQG